MMHQLLAPQFGLGLLAPRNPPESESPAARDSGPTVIVKRRRFTFADPRFDAGETTDTKDGSSTAPKESRVFRVESSPVPVVASAPHALASSPTDSSAAAEDRTQAPPALVFLKPVEPPVEQSHFALAPVPATAGSASPSTAGAPRLRRRVDPLRQPTLVQHVVFEKPPEPVVEPPARRPAETFSSPTSQALAALMSIDSSGCAEYRRVTEALSRLRGELEEAQRVKQRLADMPF